MDKLIAALGLCLAACSWTFDSQAPEIALLGEPPDPAGFLMLNRVTAGNVTMLRGADGPWWAAIDETPTPAGIGIGLPRVPVKAVQRLVRLTDPAAGPPTEEVLTATQLSVGLRTVYQIDPGMDMTAPTRVALHRPGAAVPDTVLTVPPGRLLVLTDNRERALLVWVLAKTTGSFQVFRQDSGAVRELPVMPGVDPERPQDKGRLIFDKDGDWLFAQDASGRVVAHSTTAETQVDLGVQPRGVAADPTRAALLTCDKDGLRSVPADGTAALVLDARPCEPSLLRLSDDALVTGSATGETDSEGVPVREVRLVPPAGGAPQVLVRAPLQQVLAVGDDWQVAVSRDPSSLFGNGIGDGWVGGWRFMERGRSVAFSADGSRVRWLENAATSDNVGELRMAPIGSADELHLALNVRQFVEVAPAQVLAIANAAYKGTQNRLILIDEEHRTARWVADSARDFQRIPGTEDLLVRLVTGRGYDVVRLSIPR